MIGILLKNWKFLLDVVLVIAIVIAVFLWNPFGIFGGKLKLENTANMVTEVRQIGELVTAEYYGEVIASIDEAQLNIIEDETVQERAKILYNDIIIALENLRKYQKIEVSHRVAEYRQGASFTGWRRIIRHKVDSRNIEDKLNYHGFTDELSTDPLYEVLLAYIWSEKNNIKSWNPNPRNNTEAYYHLYTQLINGELKKKEFSDLDGFMSFYYQNIRSQLSRKERRKKLAMVGRGWVKAGFDFSELDPSSILIYDELSEVHIMGLSPKVLNADINPWFIPEKGIPGFEILDHNGRVNFKDAKLVKQYCVEKLMVFAHRADILKNAELQGEETLKSLFSLLLGKEIKRVVFHSEGYAQKLNSFESDGQMTKLEVYLADSLIIKELSVIDSLKSAKEGRKSNLRIAAQKEKNLKAILHRLQALPVQGMPGRYSYFSKRVLDIAEDGILDSLELEKLEFWRLDSKNNDQKNIENMPYPLSYWYTNTMDYALAYNDAITYLLDQRISEDQWTDTVLNLSEVDSTFLNNTQIMNYQILGDSVMVYLRADTLGANNLIELLYPFYHKSEVAEAFVNSTSEWQKNIDTGCIDLAYQEGILWLVSNSQNETTACSVAEDMLHLIHHAFHYSLAKHGYVELGKNHFLVQKTDTCLQMELMQNNESLFTDKQIEELEWYVSQLILAHAEEQDKGTLDRVNEWVSNRLDNQRKTPAWIENLRNNFK
ncbi:MAG: hypothetical protein ACFCUU_07855 [Cyclobacteriaceae bacterium]